MNQESIGSVQAVDVRIGILRNGWGVWQDNAKKKKWHSGTIGSIEKMAKR